MVKFSLLARIELAIVAVLLLIPVAMIPWQKEAVLSAFHNRTLTAWPAVSVFLNRPELYFRQVSNWVADRAGPVVLATRIQKRILYYVLATPPEPRVSLGRDDHFYWNGINNAGVNALFANNCILSHNPETAAAFEKGLGALKDYGSDHGLMVYAVVVPMAPTLYADDLPAKVPRPLREYCARVLAGDTPLRKMAQRQDLNVVFPFDELKAERDDPGFFPAANYHPGPASMSVARAAFMKRFGIRTQIEQTLTAVMAPSEILGSYGIGQLFPAYTLSNPRIRSDDAANAALGQDLAEFFVGPPSTNVFINDAPDAEGTTLMLSDSLGFEGSRVFAASFKRLIWVYTNGMRHERIDQVIDRVAKTEKLDSVLMLINEAAIGRITTWAETLAAQRPR
jgi:hypothetical protein